MQHFPLQLPWERQPQEPVRVHPDLEAYRPVVGFVGQRMVPGLPQLRAPSGSVYAVGPSGHALQHVAVSDSTTLTAADPFNTLDFGVTVFLHYEKTDATLRDSSAFGSFDNTALSNRFGATLPYGDGNVYIDYGGAIDGATRLSVGGLSFGNDLWCFAIGNRGMELWQNGFLRGSNSAVPNRSGVGPWGLGNGTNGVVTNGSDLARYYSLLAFNEQVPTEICRSATRSQAAFYSTLFAPLETHWFLGGVAAPTGNPWLHYRQLAA